MTKKISILFVALFLSATKLFAQASVPTSFDFENFLLIPNGWSITDISTVGGLTYTAANSCGSQALRLDADNEALTIECGTQPGAVTFSVRATGPWAAGIFQIQESVDGITFNNMLTFNSSSPMPNASCTTLTVTPANTLSRFIRFFYQDKVSGANTAIDDVSIAAPLITAATISVEQAGNVIFNNSYANPISGTVGSGIPVAFSVKNIGTVNSLTIDSIYIDGPNATDFVINSPSSYPFTITPSGNNPLNITFTAASAGTRNAVLHIISNDALTPAYQINLYGAGNGLASEPTAQASGLTFPVNKSYRLLGSFNTANPSPDALGGYVILRREGAAVTDVPVDGTSYQRGQTIGSSKVVYAGPISGSSYSFRPTYILAGKTYHFSVFTYNGSGAVTNYNTNSPLAGSATTPSSMVSATEYNGINTSSSSFISNLSSLINPHNDQFYSTYAPTMIYLFQTRDTFVVSGPNTFTKVITCAYSREEKLYNEPFDWTGTGYSREHTYAHTWMPSYPADNPEKPEYNDQHNLFPTRQTNVNALRCNYPFGEVVNSLGSYLEGQMGTDASGKRVYEPSDKQKGRTARALMYMATCYNGISGNNWAFTDSIGNCSGFLINYGQDQNILKKWHYQFPPDAFDMSRNDFLDSLQGNRNPFVDHPEYACYIDFSNMTYIANPPVPCDAMGINSSSDLRNVYVAPNPANEEIKVYLNVAEKQSVQIMISGVTGKIVAQEQVQLNAGNNVIALPITLLCNGVYTIRVAGNSHLYTGKIIKQHTH
jgi:endonuclease I